MSAPVLSTNHAAQLLALTKGPGRGVAAPTAAANLRIMSDKASMPVGAPSIATATDYVRFMRVPAGATWTYARGLQPTAMPAGDR